MASSNFMDAYWAAPPVMRTIVAATVITSCAVYSQFLPSYYVGFYPQAFYLKFPPQVWRLITSFWLTSPNMGILFDPFFLWTYGSALEINSSRFARKGDFFAYAAFLHIVILILAGGFLGGASFLHALILGFTYTYSQDNADQQAHFFILSFSARYLPYAMLVVTLATSGLGGCLFQGTGLIAAHLYDFLTRIWPTYGGGRNWLQTPRIIHDWFGEGQGPNTGTVRTHGTAFQPRVADTGGAAGKTSGVSSSFSGWTNRGTGRRLGGD